MKRMVGWLVLLTACAVDPSEEVGTNASELVATPIRHVVLLSGGFGSCEPSGAAGVLPNELDSILSDIQTRSGARPIVVRTCYGGISNPSELSYVVTDGYMTLQAGSTTVQNLESVIQTRLAAAKPSRLDAYGHSHGGWLVGRVVQDLGPGTADSFTLNVFLSDAISRTLCTPAVVISGNGRDEGCGKFPMDLNPYTIRANVKGYFGTAYENLDWLHSTPLPGVENFAFTPNLPVRMTALNHRSLFTLPLTTGTVRPRFQYF